MTLNELRPIIIDKLKDKGFNVSPMDKTTNGVTLTGIAFNYGELMRPVFYLDQFSGSDLDTDGMTSAIIDCFLQITPPPIDCDNEFSYEGIKQNVCIGLQQITDEDLVKRPSDYDGIEEYLYLKLEVPGDVWSTKLSPNSLEAAGILEEEAWEWAEKNTFLPGETKVLNARDLSPYISLKISISSDNDFFIVSNKYKYKGASAILDKEYIKGYMDLNGYNYNSFIMIPSSIHECFLIPYKGDIEAFNGYCDTVKNVNASSVPREDQLSDRCYILTL